MILDLQGILDLEMRIRYKKMGMGVGVGWGGGGGDSFKNCCPFTMFWQFKKL